MRTHTHMDYTRSLIIRLEMRKEPLESLIAQLLFSIYLNKGNKD